MFTKDKLCILGTFDTRAFVTHFFDRVDMQKSSPPSLTDLICTARIRTRQVEMFKSRRIVYLHLNYIEVIRYNKRM